MTDDHSLAWDGYLRADGRKGIRNHLLVVYLVECAHHVSREIAQPFRARGVQVVGFGGCYPNDYAQLVLERLCSHPNAGAALLVSLGCESFDRRRLARAVADSGRPVETLVIQERGGTLRSIDAGRRWVEHTLASLDTTPRARMGIDELVVGTICGGSDACSGITANPAVGHCLDRLVAAGATAIFEETGELLGCEAFLARRARDPDVARRLEDAVAKAARYYTAMGHDSFAAGNAEGGLTTIEEKSLGSYAKSGSAPIAGVLRPGEQPPQPGLHLLDIVPDGEPVFGYPNINDNAEIAELMSCGAHLTLFTTGRGSVVGSALAPVIKVCANPETYRRMRDDMDVDAGAVLESDLTPADVGRTIFDVLVEVAGGRPSRSEALGHAEFVLTYKQLEQPGCFPGS